MNLTEEIETDEGKTPGDKLADLPVAVEQSDSTKGGAAPNFAGTWTLDKSKTQS